MKKINHVRSPLGQHLEMYLGWGRWMQKSWYVHPYLWISYMMDFFGVGTDYFLRFISDILFLDNSVCRYVCLYVLICF